MKIKTISVGVLFGLLVAIDSSLASHIYLKSGESHSIGDTSIHCSDGAGGALVECICWDASGSFENIAFALYQRAIDPRTGKTLWERDLGRSFCRHGYYCTSIQNYTMVADPRKACQEALKDTPACQKH